MFTPEKDDAIGSEFTRITRESDGKKVLLEDLVRKNKVTVEELIGLVVFFAVQGVVLTMVFSPNDIISFIGTFILFLELKPLYNKTVLTVTSPEMALFHALNTARKCLNKLRDKNIFQ